MDNPYDASARDALNIQGGRWDHAFYNGRYYVYFGIVPCLLFQLPFEAITGIQNLAYAPCMVILGLVFLISCYGILSQVVRRWFPQASTAAYLLCVAALVLGSQLYSLLIRPYIYEYAILCGAALLVLGLWLWLAAASTPVNHGGMLTVRLALGSLCVALVAGCRPQMELFALLALPIFWNRYIVHGRLRSRAGVREAVAFLLPVVVVAAGLMWYNYARFGSPFDFGATYNITGNDMTKRGFNVVRIGPAIFTSLLDLPRLQSVFPYLQETDVSTNAVILTISEKFCGGMLAATPFTWALLLPALPLARRSLHRRRGRGGHRLRFCGGHGADHGGGLPDGRRALPVSDGLQPGAAAGRGDLLAAGRYNPGPAGRGGRGPGRLAAAGAAHRHGDGPWRGALCIVFCTLFTQRSTVRG